MIKVGDRLPAGSLYEFIEVEGNGCSVGPNAFDVHKACAGKKIALFALPGAYTPTCSAKHVPGFVEKAADFKAAGIDEICAYRSTMPLSWGHGAVIRRPLARSA